MKFLIIFCFLFSSVSFANCKDVYELESHERIVHNIFLQTLSLGLHVPSYVKVMAMAKMAGADISLNLDNHPRLERIASRLYFQIDKDISVRFNDRYNRDDLYRVVKEGFENGALCPNYRPFNMYDLRVYINQQLD